MVDGAAVKQVGNGGSANGFSGDIVGSLSFEIQRPSRRKAPGTKSLKQLRRINMAKQSHEEAAKHHETAAKSHRMAAEHHGKGDHETGKKHSNEAQGHSNRAHDASKDAHNKSQTQK